MATLNKIDVPVAVNHNSKLDLSSTHITSSGFMQLQPCYYYHCIPGTRIQGNINVLSRLSPLQLPTYGRCRINMRYWFVPYRTVMPNWNDFISDTIASDVSSSSLVSGSPSILNINFVNLFLGTTGGSAAIPLSTVLTNWQTGDPYDFATSGNHYALTYQGRKYMKVLHSLGYRFTFDGKDTTVYSALAILCYAKVYLDWYTNQQYHNSADYLYIQRLFKFVDPTSSLQLSTIDLNNILWFVQTVCYDAGNDVYVNAWDNPMSPNAGNFSNHQFNDISAINIGTLPGASTQTFVNNSLLVNGTPVMQQLNAGSQNIGTEYLHSTLKAFTDYVKRNALSGADAADRLLSRFGFKLDNAALNRSTYVGECSADVDFGSVMQTVNNAGAGHPSNLGDYAGQGLGRGNGSFDYKCEEFGMFMITYSIIPAAALWQGYDPNNLHVDKMSFFHPEFDNLGCSAIPRGAVYVSKNEAFYTNTSINNLSTFGFAPRFYEYKQKSSYVTGDIESAVMAGGDAWHLNRMFDDASFNGIVDNVVHSFDFTRGVDAGTYNRIFNYTGDDIDNFYLVFHIVAQGIAPCRSLFDTYDFDDAGDKLKLSSQGAKVN